MTFWKMQTALTRKKWQNITECNTLLICYDTSSTDNMHFTHEVHDFCETIRIDENF